jgi:hypothetical protein
MYALLEFVEHTIKNCASKCIICGKDMPFVGVKPTVCDSTLCVFRYKITISTNDLSHEQYGLGVDLESSIKQYPDIVDLMISMGVAAADSTNPYFNPFEPVS